MTPESARYRQLSAQAAHELGLRQREWAGAGQALKVLATAPLWLLGWAVALLAERRR